MPNAEQIERWDGPVGEHWVENAERYSRMAAPFLDAVVAAAEPETGERVLDIGCGSGDLTFAVAQRVRPGEVVGFDISGPMLANARSRAKDLGVQDVRFVQGDAQVYDFTEPFDLVVSRFGVMFFDDLVAAFRNIASALRSGGRLAFACWLPLFDNEWITVPVTAALEHVPIPESRTLDGPGPFTLGEESTIRAVLSEAGFADVALDLFEAPMYLGSSVGDASAFMRQHELGEVLFADVSDAVAEQAVASIERALTPHARADGVYLGGKAWIVRASRP